MKIVFATTRNLIQNWNRWRIEGCNSGTCTLFLIRPRSNFSGPYYERQWTYFIRSHNNCDPILRYKINLVCLNMNATNEFTCYRQYNYHNFSGNVQRRTISMIYYRCFRQTFPSIADPVKSKSRRGMASWLVTGYDECYHCMPDYFEFVN